MNRPEKDKIINSFIQNYRHVRDKELYMNGISDESTDAICAAAITIIEYLTKEDTAK